MAHDPYDAEAIADDLARYSEDIFHADISETFETFTHGGGHAFLMDTPIGRRFKVTVAEIGQAESLTNS